MQRSFAKLYMERRETQLPQGISAIVQNECRILLDSEFAAYKEQYDSYFFLSNIP